MSTQIGADISGKRAIRVLKEKEVAEIAAAVLKDKAELPDIEACLHKTLSRYNRTAFAEREVFGQILESQLFLSRVMRQTSEELAAVRLENSQIRAELEQLRRLAQGL